MIVFLRLVRAASWADGKDVDDMLPMVEPVADAPVSDAKPPHSDRAGQAAPVAGVG